MILIFAYLCKLKGQSVYQKQVDIFKSICVSFQNNLLDLVISLLDV